MTGLKRIYDIDAMMEWRREVLEEVFGMTPDEGLMSANREYYLKHMTDGTHRAYMALTDGHGVGCGAVCLYDELPSPDNPTGRCGYIMNVYVRMPYRHRGIASALVRHLIEDAKAERCGKIYLETTDMGRGVYAESGFMEMKDMMKYEH